MVWPFNPPHLRVCRAQRAFPDNSQSGGYSDWWRHGGARSSEVKGHRAPSLPGSWGRRSQAVFYFSHKHQHCERRIHVFEPHDSKTSKTTRFPVRIWAILSNKTLKHSVASQQKTNTNTDLLVCSRMSALSSCLGKENDSGVSDICSRTSSHLWSSVWNLYTLHTWAHSTAHTHTQRLY